MNVAVIGLGYLGLIVGARLAEPGNDVISADRPPGLDGRNLWRPEKMVGVGLEYVSIGQAASGVTG